MSSSPMKICNFSPCDNPKDVYSSSPEPTMCDCQNQLVHFGWDGIPHENLPDLCKQTMGMRTEVGKYKSLIISMTKFNMPIR